MKISNLFGKPLRPETLQFMDQRDYDRMINLVRGCLVERGEEFTLDKAAGTVKVGEMLLGLTNLGQMCHMSAHEDWPELVNEMIEIGMSAEITENPAFEDVKSLLKVRLNSVDLGPQPEIFSMLTLFEVSDRFLTYLTIDHPKQVSTVKPEVAQGWGISEPELMKLALDNVWAQDHVEAEWMELGEDLTLATLHGESFFTSTHLLMLNRHFPIQPEAGMLVTVPTRHMIMIRPLDSAKDLAVLGAMAYIARNAYEEGPGSITDNVFWIREGRLTPLDLDLVGDGVHLLGPPEFEEVLGTLG